VKALGLSVSTPVLCLFFQCSDAYRYGKCKAVVDCWFKKKKVYCYCRGLW